jgi:hypothetical protein
VLALAETSVHGMPGKHEMDVIQRVATKAHTQRICEILSLGRTHLTIAVVDLGTDKELWSILASITVDFRHPALDVLEADLVQDVIHQNYSMGTAVVRAGDGAETLLAGSIPDLHLNLLAVEL